MSSSFATKRAEALDAVIASMLRTVDLGIECQESERVYHGKSLVSHLYYDIEQMAELNDKKNYPPRETSIMNLAKALATMMENLQGTKMKKVCDQKKLNGYTVQPSLRYAPSGEQQLEPVPGNPALPLSVIERRAAKSRALIKNNDNTRLTSNVRLVQQPIPPNLQEHFSNADNVARDMAELDALERKRMYGEAVIKEEDAVVYPHEQSTSSSSSSLSMQRLSGDMQQPFRIKKIGLQSRLISHVPSTVTKDEQDGLNGLVRLVPPRMIPIRQPQMKYNPYNRLSSFRPTILNSQRASTPVINLTVRSPSGSRIVRDHF